MNTVFVIGAGFAKPAGFPLGAELFERILDKAKSKGQYEGNLQSDIKRFLNYKQRTNPSKEPALGSEGDINFEDFISFLDIEHFLGLAGSDTWSSEGNLTQLLVRNLIGEVLFDSLQQADDETLDLYRYFASHLKPGDVLITFNYDTLLEAIFREMEIPYRLFPNRYNRVYPSHGEVNNQVDEIVLMKLHGSIDWFDISPFENKEDYFRHGKQYIQPKHIVFRNHKEFWPEKIVDAPYFKESALQRVYRISDVEKYYQSAVYWREAPLIVSPSFNKLAYLNPLEDLWYGLGEVGGINKRVAIIGFSLPKHDEYVRQPLYAIVSNFQSVSTEGIFEKSNLKMIDYRIDEQSKQDYMTTYCFVDWSQCDCYFHGFDRTAVDLIFDL